MDFYGLIPLRVRDCCQPDGSARFRLSDRPLWEETFRHGRECALFKQIIVAYDQPEFEAHMSDFGEFEKFLRPPGLSDPGVTTVDVLQHVARTRTALGDDDYLMLLEITHPLRPRGILEEMIRVVKQAPVDALITVRPVRNNFWRKDPDGPIYRMEGPGDDAQVIMYKELLGIGSLFRVGTLRGDSPFGEHVDVAPIRGSWAGIDVRDQESLDLARCFLRNLNS